MGDDRDDLTMDDTNESNNSTLDSFDTEKDIEVMKDNWVQRATEEEFTERMITEFGQGIFNPGYQVLKEND